MTQNIDSITQLKIELEALANTQIAEHSRRYFKTGKGQYGEGDVFLGIRMPDLRRFVPKCRHFNLDEVTELLTSGRHEERLLAVIIWGDQMKRAKDKEVQQAIYQRYLDHTDYINNWDIVDSSSPQIVGFWLLPLDNREVLYRLIDSKCLWDRRIAILATLAFIRDEQFGDIKRLAVQVLEDKEDLIHKASGWMLREMGKRQIDELRDFLDKHSKNMPRTMLNYATERLDSKERKRYMER